MVATTIHKYAHLLSNYYVIGMVQILRKFLNREFPKNFAFLMHEVPSGSKQQPRSCYFRETRREAN